MMPALCAGWAAAPSPPPSEAGSIASGPRPSPPPSKSPWSSSSSSASNASSERSGAGAPRRPRSAQGGRPPAGPRRVRRRGPHGESVPAARRAHSGRCPRARAGAPAALWHVYGCEPRFDPRQLSASRDALCDTCTSGSTCAAGVARGCSACSCSFGSSGACTLRMREWRRSGRLRGPSTRFPSRNDRSWVPVAGAIKNAARRHRRV